MKSPLRRGGTALAAAVFGATALVACSPAGTAGSDGPVTVDVWHGFTEADGKVVQRLADEFNESQDDYRVKIEVNPWNVITDKLLPAMSSGNGPALVVQGVDAGQGYVRQGVFASLQSFYDDPENETETYYEHVVDYTVFDGETYGVPMGYAPFAVWYNKDMFAAAGVTEFPQTQDEWIALAKKLTVDENGDGTPEIYGLSLADKATTFLPTWLEAGGGDVFADGEVVLDTPQNVKTLEWWRDAYAENWGPTNITLPEAVDLFKAGKAAMVVIGPWMIGIADSVGLDVGVFEVPAGEEKRAAQAAANYWWLTSQGAKDERVAEGAQAFLRYFNSHDSQIEWALEGNYPPNRDDITADELAENPFVAEMLPFTENTYIRLADLPGGLTDVNAELDTLSQKVTHGEDDIAGAVAETSGKLAGILSEFE
ncbi:extracellular solute-binding protein [Microbacterium esteraromaticum]|uniref:Extracellular solute-binding protein n=1 Tax=Microbacterium esteraromaticum TaxID=57043 RepID=A0A7D8ADA8_9MICO|nr:ABC transporter substrate-binding protein [Microbacterium esteraromaticum]QMU96423.1 extracellular solute-binding protein [Microbacterium esteraromaticum]